MKELFNHYICKASLPVDDKLHETETMCILLYVVLPALSVGNIIGP